jgi:hypothetical protein
LSTVGHHLGTIDDGVGLCFGNWRPHGAEQAAPIAGRRAWARCRKAVDDLSGRVFDATLVDIA